MRPFHSRGIKAIDLAASTAIGADIIASAAATTEVSVMQHLLCDPVACIGPASLLI